ncbi:MAG: sigma-E processing peptidase SpoIIGA [Clostridia bacterium]|nr:sigma-E processing peptidase SpoIIGA [Clostridia bacterium]
MGVFIENFFIIKIIEFYFLYNLTTVIFNSERRKDETLLLSIIYAFCVSLLSFIIKKVVLIEYILSTCCILFLVKININKQALNIVFIYFILKTILILLIKFFVNLLNLKTEIEFFLLYLLVIFSLNFSIQVILINGKKSIVKKRFVYKTRLIIGENSYDCLGFLDTGNQVYDGVFPVVLCGKKLSQKIKNGTILVDTYVLKLTTAIGVGQVKLIKNAKILVENLTNNYKIVSVGLLDKSLKSDLLLHPDLL